VRKILGGINRPRIVDVGCGAGATLKELEKLGSVTGVDISPRAVSYCQNRGCRRICLVEEESLPLSDKKISLIISLDVLEHLDRDYLHLREYRRALQDDGKLLITVPALSWLWSSHDVANHHRRRYPRTHLKKLLEREGWRIERLTYFCTFLFPLIPGKGEWCYRLMMRLDRGNYFRSLADWKRLMETVGLFPDDVSFYELRVLGCKNYHMVSMLLDNLAPPSAGLN